jgi:hypothetical protein
MRTVATIVQGRKGGLSKVVVTVSSRDQSRIERLTHDLLFALGTGTEIVRDERTANEVMETERTRGNEQG